MEPRVRGTNLLWCVLIFGKIDHLIGHLVDRSDNLEHFVVGDKPVAVNVIELESPYRDNKERSSESAQSGEHCHHRFSG